MDRQRLVRLSKQMSLALRHAPDQFGLILDAGGWVAVDEVLAAMRIQRRDLHAVVADNDKQRFALDRDAAVVERIRANRGHSVSVDVGPVPQPPPPSLYHGTTIAALGSIRATGLHHSRRHHVHLSADVDTGPSGRCSPARPDRRANRRLIRKPHPHATNAPG